MGEMKKTKLRGDQQQEGNSWGDWWNSAKTYGAMAWEKSIPWLNRAYRLGTAGYRGLKRIAKPHYEKYVEPHVTRVSESELTFCFENYIKTCNFNKLNKIINYET
jgi:hypothetical protein